MNLSLRHKFYLGFGGLLAITLLVTSIGANVVKAYSSALQQMLRENYASVVYGENMKDAQLTIENAIQLALSGHSAARDTAVQAAARFETNLEAEQGNITLPGEAEAAAALLKLWREYSREFGAALDTSLSPAVRNDILWKTIIPLGHRLHSAAQKICDMNIANMSSVDGLARAKAEEATFVIYLLVFAGALLALALILITGRAILQPLRILTDSVREIQKGNLNIVLQPRSRDEVGQLTGAFNEMAAQLREYRRSERAKLIRTEHSTQSVIDSLPDAVAIANVSGIVEMSNRDARDMFGLFPEVNLTTRRDDVLRQLFYSALLMEEPGESGGMNNALQVFRKGEEKFFLPRAIPIFGEARNVIGVALVLADVTRHKRVIELEVEPISVVSHELKTPLTSMRLAIHMLLDERIGPLNARQAELLAAARDDSERLNRIMENLLDLSRIESGRVPLDLKPCSPHALISPAVDSFLAAYRSAGVGLVSHVAEDVPDVLADTARITHVFSNLLSNALRYSSSGQTVSISAATDGEDVRFSVHDQGAGIAADQLPHVFEKFFRAQSAAKSEGAGLGLAIAKDVVEAHGGRIWAESVPGQGSIFSFTLRSV